MKFIFTRHGETEENVAGISMGQTIGGTLTEKGREQARKLALNLMDQKIDYIYTSDLKRALDTAEEIIKFHPKAKLVPVKELRERHIGIYGGGPRDVWQNLMRSSNEPFHIFKPEQGESYKEVQERISKFYSKLIRQQFGETIVFVSHAGILTTLFLMLHDRPLTQEEFKRFKPSNAAISIYEYKAYPESHIWHEFNSIKHLLDS